MGPVLGQDITEAPMFFGPETERIYTIYPQDRDDIRP